MFDLLLVHILGMITEWHALFLDGAQHISREVDGATFLVTDGK